MNAHTYRAALVTAVVTLGVTAAATIAADQPPPTNRRDYRDRYGVLSEKNIFLKDRSRPTNTRPSGQGSFGNRDVRRPVPETAYLLTGIVFEEGQFRAYVEDGPRSKIVRLAPGEAVARGRVEHIEINGIVYVGDDGRQTWVEIGQNLTGNALVASSTGDDPAGPTTAPATSAALPIDPNDPTLTFEQKMKLRRQQELKGK